MEEEMDGPKHRIRTFVLIWAPLLFFMRSSNAETGASLEGREFCSRENDQYCITLTEAKITAEAGLCVVIPCSFTTDNDFRPQTAVWYKCDAARPNCGEADVIFHSNVYNRYVQPGFKGRVLLLESRVWWKNCSIIINDLKESDSGSYQFRVKGYLHGRASGFSFSPRATVSVKGLSQKPTVAIPPLTAGRPATLTCTAPGLCFGSEPSIGWTWRGAGERGSHITGNITALRAESLVAFARRHSSTLTFNPSAEHHGTNITCEVTFAGQVTTEETATLIVTYVKEVRISQSTSVKEGETLNLTCSVESFPPSLIAWTKLSDQNGTGRNLQNDTLTDLRNDTERHPQEKGGTATLYIPNVAAEDSGQYICTVQHLNNTWTGNVNVTVIYVREPVITGHTAVNRGDDLHLTCSVDSFPPSLVKWTKLGSSTNLHSGSDMRNDTGSATLIIPNVATGHSGRYICAAEHLYKAVTVYADVTVTWFSNILKNSGCGVQSEVLTCVCVSEGFPLPAIEWPLLKNNTEYSIITTVSNHTVNSTVVLTVKGRPNTSVECVSSNINGEARENLTIGLTPSGHLGEGPSPKMSQNVSWLGTFIAFFIGAILSAVICFLAKTCHRKKQGAPGNLDETLEMVTGQEDTLMHDGQAATGDQTHGRGRAEDGTVAVEKRAPGLDTGPEDVNYVSIDFSRLKRKSGRDAAEKQETTETVYAEIKKQAKEERGGDGGAEGEMLEGKDEEAMIEEDEETKRCVPQEEEGDDLAVYSNVQDIMAAM
ncbi:myelin-associated glycoprotein [Scophthalmus maximus]|uniref:myelin-associated glycoprotein n=1 Tax=Scophthalmus maximus TaxID=52904 RepID=UPI001FA85BF5|nr:myelin-associated glycoprotein [Scophthalmus maximus]